MYLIIMRTAITKRAAKTPTVGAKLSDLILHCTLGCCVIVLCVGQQLTPAT